MCKRQWHGAAHACDLSCPPGKLFAFRAKNNVTGATQTLPRGANIQHPLSYRYLFHCLHNTRKQVCVQMCLLLPKATTTIRNKVNQKTSNNEKRSTRNTNPTTYRHVHISVWCAGSPITFSFSVPLLKLHYHQKKQKEIYLSPRQANISFLFTRPVHPPSPSTHL